MNASYWLDRATAKIRFAPERSAVRRELADHIQDRQDGYLARGLEMYEAEQRAVADMGDPNAIAEELGRLHAPWWGWLWKLSRAALVLAAVWLAVSLFSRLQADGLPDWNGPARPRVGDVFSYADGWPGEVVSVWEVEDSVRLGGYRFSVPAAYLEYREPWTFVDGHTAEGGYTLFICLRAATWKIWEPCSQSQDMILRHAAVDSGGAQYGRAGFDEFAAYRDYFCRTCAGGPGISWYEVRLELPDGEVPDWVEIPIGCGGCLRVNLAKGVVTE